MSRQTGVLVTGADGFIGHHLVMYLKKQSGWVRRVDIKHPEFSSTDADEFELLNLRRWDNCLQATRDMDEVYALAADCYIDDCVIGIYKLMQSDYHEPLNLSQDHLVTINQLADIIATIAGAKIAKEHAPGPQGVRGRNSDNTRLRQVLGWEPEISLEKGLVHMYTWIEEQVRVKLETALESNIVAMLSHSQVS